MERQIELMNEVWKNIWMYKNNGCDVKNGWRKKEEIKVEEGMVIVRSIDE